MSVEGVFEKLEEPPSELEHLQSSNYDNNATYAVFTSSNGQYDISINNDKIFDGEPEFGITITRHLPDIETVEQYKRLIGETQDYDRIEAEITNTDLVLSFNDIDTEPESHIEPEPEHVDAVLEGENHLDRIYVKLAAGDGFDDIEEVKSYVNSVIRDMDEVCEKFN